MLSVRQSEPVEIVARRPVPVPSSVSPRGLPSDGLGTLQGSENYWNMEMSPGCCPVRLRMRRQSIALGSERGSLAGWALSTSFSLGPEADFLVSRAHPSRLIGKGLGSRELSGGTTSHQVGINGVIPWDSLGLSQLRRAESNHLPPGYEPGELPVLYSAHVD